MNDRPWKEDMPCAGLFFFNKKAKDFIENWFAYPNEEYYFKHPYEQNSLYHIDLSDTGLIDDWMFRKVSGQFIRHIGTDQKELRVPEFTEYAQTLPNLVSIIIPCYNQSQWLGDAIQSALDQTIPCEIIVVNDGSTDNTSEIAKKYPVKLIEKKNGGLSSARNAGIREAIGTYIVCLDADDKIDPQYVEKCLKNKGNYDIIGTGQKEFGDSNASYFFMEYPGIEDFKRNNQMNCSVMYPKAMWQEIGGYDETMLLGYEDWMFNLKAVLAGYKVKILREHLFYYRKHGVSMINGAIKNHNKLKKYIFDILKLN